jgi:hypothetical protein
VPRARLLPHYAEFIIGPAEGRTQWLHAGYELLRVIGHTGKFISGIPCPD